ncbi:CUB domain-containing protein [Flavobacterium sp.]|uniref:fibronectin type III domain-containing protein n=1 Tax=Flavobacterium sp. TaxID=239 RepID=UPI0025EDFCFB|nr:CUB domain-containing protein [Flavobacterium sp.]
MKKITLLLFLLFISFSGYSQLPTEGFENTTGISGPLPATWALGTGNWAVFERNSNPSFGTVQRWGINAFATGLQYQGTNCASVNREQIGAGNTSEDFLATPAVTIPATGISELHFWTRMFTSGNQGTIYKVMVAPVAAGQTTPANYSLLQQWTELDLIIPTSNFNVYTEKVVDLSAYAGFDIYVAFVREYTQPTAALDGDRWLIDNVGIAPQCTAPVAATPTVLTSTTAQLNWSNPSGATTWEIEVVPAAGTPTGIPNYPAYSGTLPFLATVLLPNTAYKFYVRALCSTGFTSPWSLASGNFTTQVAPPVCGGNLVDSGGTAGNYSNNENSTTTVTPPAMNVTTVTFTAFNTEAGADVLKIYDGPDATFPLLATLSGTTLPPSYTSTAVNGELTFVFTSNGTVTSTGYAANITCGIAPVCRIPTAVTSSLITTTSVSLNWTQPTNPDTTTSSTWDIIALPCGSPAPTAASVPTVNDLAIAPPYILGSLTPATCYDIYVRAVCSANSGWSSVPRTISTLVAPPVCGGNFVDTGGSAANYSNNSNLTTIINPSNVGDAVTVTFTSFNTQAGIDILRVYDGNSAAAPLLATLSGTTLPPSFTASSPSGSLTFVFTSDGTITAAGWIANVTCAPPPSCSAPTTITSSAFTYNSATLSWVQPANPDSSVASSWQVLALACGSPAPAPTATGFVTANTNSNFVLTPLAANSCFNIYIRAVCGATTSAWSSVPITINTPIAPPICGGNFLDSGGLTTVIGTGVPGQYGNNENITTTICPTNPGDVVTVTFTSFNTEATWDGLYVYNGNAVVPANIIASANGAGNVPGGIAGSYWGNLTGAAIPGPFTSTSSDGCLTFVFRSDGSGLRDGWVANVSCALPPTCRKPTSLGTTGLTFNSVSLNWVQPTNPDTTVATAWQVLRLPCGSPLPTATSTGFIDNIVNPSLLTGLSSATCYDIYIRAVCSPIDSSTWSGPITITTLDAPPVCGGNFVDNGGTTANYAANSNDTTTICPTNPGDVVTVTFTTFNTEANYDALYVYNGNAVVPANLIPSNNPPANVPGGLAGGYWGTTIPCPFTSADANGCLTFVFRSDASVQLAGWTANITCGPPPACNVPSALTSSNVRHNSVVLNWIQPANADASVASAWQVLALPCGSPAPTATATGIVDVTTSPPFQLTPLTPSTCYDIYVRANCGSSTSAWVCTPATVTTLATPPTCGGVFTDAGGTALDYANNSNIPTYICPTNPGDVVTVTFTSFNTQATSDGLYVYDGNGIVPSNQISSTNGPGTVPGLIPGSFWGALTGGNLPGPFTATNPDGCLTFVFRSNGFTTAAGWVANVTCAPAPTCSKPTLLNASAITQTSAVLNWTQVPNPNASVANAWEVLILPTGSTIPTGPGIPVTSTTYPQGGLTAGTAYVLFVRAICSPTDASIWAAYNFATIPSNDECFNATFAVVNQNLNCVQTTPGTLIGATGSLPTTTCPGAANDDVWFTFTATAVTHVISFNNVTTPAPVLDYAIFQGNNCGALTQVGCNSGANLIPGTTYYIRVYSDSALPQFTNFNLCIGTLPCSEAPAFCTGQTVTYANATNVPSLGQIGCLFTSPNPAFFFLQVNQAGPLSYLISQTSTGGTGLDVDYVAWGPFTNLSTACAGVPANPLAGQSPPLTPTQGCNGNLHACSYSAAPTEIMCIPNAQLCEVYVIMITNYSNQVGTVTFSQTNQGGGTTQCFPINTFNYPSTYYCQNQPNPTPVLAPAATSGVYSSTVGLVFTDSGTNSTSNTGEINLLASIPGPYVITSTTLTSTGGACTNIPTITTTRTVIITAPASATISYAAATYCNNIATAQPVNRIGTSGGTYSSSPSGLLLNSNTGEIIPVASTPNIYTVTYTIPAAGGCSVFTTTTTVEILASPVVVQASVAACDTFTLPALTAGNYYAIAGGVGSPLNISTPITSTQPVYIYVVGTNGCITDRQFTVTINTVATPTYTVTQSTCTAPTGSITVNSPTGSGSPIPSNLFISEVTDANSGSLTYVELYNGTGAPVNLANYKLKFYTWGSPPTAENLSCNLQLSGTIANNTTNVIKVSNDANIAGVVPNQTFTGCGGVNNNDNIRLTTATDVEIDLWGVTNGSTFTPSGQPGYTYRRLNTATVPSTTWNPADWTALDPEDYTNLGSYSLPTSNYQYSIDNGVTFVSNPVFSPLAIGNYSLVVKDIATGCLSAPIAIAINPTNPTPSVTTFSYTTPVCQNATTNPIPDTSAAGFTTGGTFTSNPAAGIDLNATTGEINLINTIAGTYVITYGVPFNTTTCVSAGSTDFTIVINPVVNPILGFSYTTPICQNAQATLAPTLVTGFTTGGTFTSTSGLSIDGASGLITFATSTPGPYTITYTSNADLPSCLVGGSNTFNIIINPVITPVTSFSYDTPFCSNDAINLQSPALGTGFTNGGTFTSTTNLSIDAATGVINTQSSTPGPYTITYTIAANVGTCQIAGTGTAQVMIIPPVIFTIVGGCESIKYVLTATPVNGSFNPSTASYQWYNTQGLIVGENAQSLTVPATGNYTVKVTVDGCDTISAPFNVLSIICQIQKGISVNNDGLNDTFDLTGFNVKKLTIFNRLGMTVYTRNDYTNEWGGKSDKGDDLPDGTYYYVIDRNNGEVKTGWIYINRAQ